jgi:hypothetical protein
MYQVANIPISKFTQIASLPINRQSDIEAQYGSKLQLTQVIEYIRQISKNYTVSHPVAEEMDGLVVQLLEKKGFSVSGLGSGEPAIAKPAPAPKKEPAKAKHKYPVGFKFTFDDYEYEVTEHNGIKNDGIPEYVTQWFDEDEGEMQPLLWTEKEIDENLEGQAPKPEPTPDLKSTLQTKIKGFETALKFADGELKKTLETKIKGFKIALKFA